MAKEEEEPPPTHTHTDNVLSFLLQIMNEEQHRSIQTNNKQIKQRRKKIKQ